MEKRKDIFHLRNPPKLLIITDTIVGYKLYTHHYSQHKHLLIIKPNSYIKDELLLSPFYMSEK